MLLSFKTLPVYILLLFLSAGVLQAKMPEEKKVQIHEIEILKNKKTKRSTIIRELEFNEGDTILINTLATRLSKAEENLMNTSLFNFVEFKPIFSSDSTQLDIEISLIERWYVWPIPLLEIADRNFNQWWKDKDFSRLNYGLMLKWENFTGRKDLLKTIIRLGHEEKLGFFYEIPFFNDKKNLGFEAALSYARHHEIGVNSVNNKLQYFKDEDIFVHENLEAYFHLVYRPKIHQKQYIHFNYRHINIDETLISNFPDFTVDGLKNLSFLGLAYKFISDHRDYKPYPLTGYYFDISLNKVGLGIIRPRSVDFLFVRSNLNFYWKLKNHWYLGAGLLTKISNSKFQPYVLQKGLGYKQDFIRGYELYVMDGQNFALYRSNLKYELIPKRVHNFKFIKNEKFSKLFYSLYANLFLDVGYVDDAYNAELNSLVNSMQYSIGLGLDFVTYYDLVFRVELSRNKLKEHSVFFHVKAAF